MARLAEETEFPGTYNFVPCLLEQVLEYAAGTANDPFQAALEKDPGKLTYADVRLLSKIVPGRPIPAGFRTWPSRPFSPGS